MLGVRECEPLVAVAAIKAPRHRVTAVVHRRPTQHWRGRPSRDRLNREVDPALHGQVQPGRQPSPPFGHAAKWGRGGGSRTFAENDLEDIGQEQRSAGRFGPQPRQQLQRKEEGARSIRVSRSGVESRAPRRAGRCHAQRAASASCVCACHRGVARLARHRVHSQLGRTDRRPSNRSLTVSPAFLQPEELTFTPLPHLGLENVSGLFIPFGTNQALQSFASRIRPALRRFRQTLRPRTMAQFYYLGGLVAPRTASLPCSAKTTATSSSVRGDSRELLHPTAPRNTRTTSTRRCVHRTTLAIVCDFVIVERLVARRRSRSRSSLRSDALLVFCFGLEASGRLAHGMHSRRFCHVRLHRVSARLPLFSACARSRVRSAIRIWLRFGSYVMVAGLPGTLATTLWSRRGHRRVFAVLWRARSSRSLVATKSTTQRAFRSAFLWSRDYRPAHPHFRGFILRSSRISARSGVTKPKVGYRLGWCAVSSCWCSGILGLVQSKEALAVRAALRCLRGLHRQPSGLRPRSLDALVRLHARLLSRNGDLQRTVLALFALGLSPTTLSGTAPAWARSACSRPWACSRVHTFLPLKMAPGVRLRRSLHGPHEERSRSSRARPPLDFPLLHLGWQRRPRLSVPVHSNG